MGELTQGQQSLNGGGFGNPPRASLGAARFTTELANPVTKLPGSDWQIRTAVSGGGFGNPPRASLGAARFGLRQAQASRRTIGKSEPQ
ncbi:MAG: hypothetical protein DRI57_06595 [Deltaproteobacteria bacterium]|nr:MAG: hypothetical protein DRI57_06595 [Deltaproteobacteria bacterium]